jgi:predicted MFS family arabinose efflux permease
VPFGPFERLSERTPPASVPPVTRARWLVLAAFTLLVAATQLLWLGFAPVTSEVGRSLGVSDAAVGNLAAVNPLVYVLLALPAGRWADRRLGPALALGAVLTAGGALVRLVDPGSYGWILAGQLVMSAGQPLVLNATTKVAARWFPPADRTTAISVGSAGQFVGILVAALSGAPVAAAGGVGALLVLGAVVSTLGALATLLALRVPPAFPDEAPASRALPRDRTLWLLAGLLFVGVGIFNATATWLDVLVGGLGLPAAGGPLVALMTVTGIAGAAIVPRLAARHGRRRAALLVTPGAVVVAFAVVAAGPGVVVTAVALGVAGFFLLAGLPVALDWSEARVGAGDAATATALLLLAGNLGGVVLVLVVEPLIATPVAGLLAIAALAVPGLVIAAFLPSRTDADAGTGA